MDLIRLGVSELRVTPVFLGTMTFGDDWGWGADDTVSRQLFDAYVEAGGNLFDTADLYTGGRSEEMLGRFIAEAGLRDAAVIATKFSFNAAPAIPTPAATAARTFCARWRGR